MHLRNDIHKFTNHSMILLSDNLINRMRMRIVAHAFHAPHFFKLQWKKNENFPNSMLELRFDDGK